tara:strand:- start:3063 stop:3515 length:453 start_codon:yes stop_codon:yes gene_type:complete
MAKNTLALGAALKQAYRSPKACPVATQDIHVNLKNRNHAIEEYGYGPLNPDEPNPKFWARLSKMWGITSEEAKTSRCGNCAAFVQTKEMIACIERGIAFDPDEPPANQKAEAVTAKKVVELSNLGYCQLFHFKCAGDRTCDAWLIGGPIK